MSAENHIRSVLYGWVLYDILIWRLKIWSALPSQILNDSNTRCSVIGLSAEVRICKKLCQSTGGKYNLTLCGSLKYDLSHDLIFINIHSLTQMLQMYVFCYILGSLRCLIFSYSQVPKLASQWLAVWNSRMWSYCIVYDSVNGVRKTIHTWNYKVINIQFISFSRFNLFYFILFYL